MSTYEIVKLKQKKVGRSLVLSAHAYHALRRYIALSHLDIYSTKYI